MKTQTRRRKAQRLITEVDRRLFQRGVQFDQITVLIRRIRKDRSEQTV